jgi:hypothetical protein
MTEIQEQSETCTKMLVALTTQPYLLNAARYVLCLQEAEHVPSWSLLVDMLWDHNNTKPYNQWSAEEVVGHILENQNGPIEWLNEWFFNYEPQIVKMFGKPSCALKI